LKNSIDGILIEPSGGFLRFENSSNFQVLKALTIPVSYGLALSDPTISYVAPDDVEGAYERQNI
jgi:DNA-binding LacI/PurR family transcriptional regulator